MEPKRYGLHHQENVGKKHTNKLTKTKTTLKIISETSDTITTELASEALALSMINSNEAMYHLVKHAPKRCLTGLKGYLSLNERRNYIY